MIMHISNKNGSKRSVITKRKLKALWANTEQTVAAKYANGEQIGESRTLQGLYFRI